MIVTPADRKLAAAFVDTFADSDTGIQLAQFTAPLNLEPAADDQEYEFAFFLVAVARRMGWTPPTETG